MERKKQKGANMKPNRYPYSGEVKKPIEQPIDFMIDKDAILQLDFRISQSKHPISDLEIEKRMAF